MKLQRFRILIGISILLIGCSLLTKSKEGLVWFALGTGGLLSTLAIAGLRRAAKRGSQAEEAT